MPKNPGNRCLARILHQCFAVLVFLLALMMSPVSLAQEAGVNARLSASTITRDESVTLTITATGIDAELDASSLNKDFDVIGRSSSRELSTRVDSNNQMVTTNVVTWALELLPRGVGIYTVPAVKVGDFETQLQTLTVNEVPSGAKRDIFVEATVDTSEPWVQSQVVMTLRVFQAIDIVDGGLDVPVADDLVVERLGDDTRSREVRDGREYSVTERRFALFPQRSGSITIAPVMLSVTVPAEPDRVRGFFSPTRKLTRRSDSVTLNVQARPPGGAAWWLPAKNLQLFSEWQGNPNEVQIDQPLTRTVIVRADGVLESQLPTISIPAVDGLSLYAEEPAVGSATGPNGLISEQRINWALIPQRSGTLTLPAVSVEWFNTLTGKTETAELPAETITVLAGSSSSNGGTTTDAIVVDNANQQADNGASESIASLSDIESINQAPASSSASGSLAASSINLDNNTAMRQVEELQDSVDRWRMLTIFAVGLWVLSLAFLWMYRRTSATAQTPSAPKQSSLLSDKASELYLQIAPMNQLENACQSGDLWAIKEALLAWAARQWPHRTISTLDDLQRQFPDGDARSKLAKLQTALYSRRPDAGSKPELNQELADLSTDLKHALQQLTTDNTDSPLNTNTANTGSVSARGSTRLPRL